MDYLSELLLKSADLASRGSGNSLVSLDTILAEEPVPLDVFIKDKKYLGEDITLSPIQYSLIQHVERVYYPDVYPVLGDIVHPYWSEPIPMINEACAQWGKGAGKDLCARLSALRVSYLLLCLKNPLQYYGLPTSDSIHILNVAANSDQAKEAFFAPLTRAVRKGWFADRCAPYLNKVHMEKNIECISGHSDADSQEGKNIILGIADELDAFKSKAELEAARSNRVREPSNSAEAIIKMLRSSGKSRFPEVYKNIYISWPRYKGSMIQSLTEEGRLDIEKAAEEGRQSKYYVSGPLASWDVNPRVPGKDKFKKEYDEDPLGAAARYECRPSLATNTYFRNKLAVQECFVHSERPPVTVDYQLLKNGFAEVWNPVYDFATSFRPIPGAQYVMHADLAKNGDRAGIALAHVKSNEEFVAEKVEDDGEVHQISEVRPVVTVDFAISFEANLSLDPPREIQIRWARELCFLLKSRGFVIRMFTFDGWQSLDSIQTLEQVHGIKSKRVSTDISESVWKNFRDVVYEGRVKIPHSELLENEIFGLSRSINGKIDHPAHSSKDVADAVACAIQGAIEIGGREVESSSSDQSDAFATGPILYVPQGFSRDRIGGGYGGV